VFVKQKFPTTSTGFVVQQTEINGRRVLQIIDVKMF